MLLGERLVGLAGGVRGRLVHTVVHTGCVFRALRMAACQCPHVRRPHHCFFHRIILPINPLFGTNVWASAPQTVRRA